MSAPYRNLLLTPIFPNKINGTTFQTVLQALGLVVILNPFTHWINSLLCCDTQVISTPQTYLKFYYHHLYPTHLISPQQLQKHLIGLPASTLAPYSPFSTHRSQRCCLKHKEYDGVLLPKIFQWCSFELRM